MALILDTSVLLAAVDRRERDHAACRKVLEEGERPLVLPAPILPELDYLVSERVGTAPMLLVVRDVIADGYRVYDPDAEDYERIVEIMDRYADQDVGFVDASVLAIAERLDEPKVATLDRRHFSVMRPRHCDALELLP